MGETVIVMIAGEPFQVFWLLRLERAEGFLIRIVTDEGEP
jgi:hypothetical protein